ncbi:MAG: major capsid protein [Planctomycetota bacterium]|jgi:hypothetical protein
MASVTLVESAKLAQDELVAGVIENVITVNPFYEVLPFDGIDGNALAYNRENVLGEVVLGTVGTSIASGSANPITAGTDGTAAATFTQVTSTLTRIIGQAEVDNLIQTTRSGDGNDQKAIQIASKAKHAGRVYQHMLVNGTGSNDQFNGMINLCASGQKVDTGVNGGPLSFAWLDQLLHLVKDKDGTVDFITMNSRTLVSYNELLRGLGGASINEVVKLPSGQEVPGYRKVPIFRNDYLPIDQTKGGGSDQTTVFAGTLDDGSRQHGIAGLTAAKQAGMRVREIGESETKDESLTRVVWYCGLALFSELGLACADGITD